MADANQATSSMVNEKQKTPFATRAQNWVMVLLVISLLLVAQPFSIDIFGL